MAFSCLVHLVDDGRSRASLLLCPMLWGRRPRARLALVLDHENEKFRGLGRARVRGLPMNVLWALVEGFARTNTCASCRCGSDAPPGGYSTLSITASLPALPVRSFVVSGTTIAVLLAPSAPTGSAAYISNRAASAPVALPRRHLVSMPVGFMNAPLGAISYARAEPRSRTRGVRICHRQNGRRCGADKAPK